MNEYTRSSARIAIALAVGVIAATSAFADSRHRQATSSEDKAPAPVTRRLDAPLPSHGDRVETDDRATVRDDSDRTVLRDAAADSSIDTGRGRPMASQEPGHGRAPRGSWQQAPRDRDRREPTAANDRGKKAPHYAHGTVSKVRPYKDGYRVWIAGASHPYYVPQAYWRPGYFNVGMTIRVGGYYNPRGWYDYYGDYECNAIAEERVRGVVENIDPRRGEILLDIAGGGYLTVAVGNRHEYARPGDFVVVYGNWNRWGRFVAVDVDVIDRAHRW